MLGTERHDCTAPPINDFAFPPQIAVLSEGTWGRIGRGALNGDGGNKARTVLAKIAGDAA